MNRSNFAKAQRLMKKAIRLLASTGWKIVYELLA